MNATAKKLNEAVEKEWKKLNICKHRINYLLINIPKHEKSTVRDTNMVQRVKDIQCEGEYMVEKLSSFEKSLLIKWHKEL